VISPPEMKSSGARFGFSSLLPVLIRVLPPLTRDARTSERDANYGVAVVGLFLYVVVVGGVIALISID
jgi:hypothetical protein